MNNRIMKGRFYYESVISGLTRDYQYTLRKYHISRGVKRSRKLNYRELRTHEPDREIVFNSERQLGADILEVYRKNAPSVLRDLKYEIRRMQRELSRIT